MEDGLLSLKWNNHKSTFIHTLSSVRRKNTYSDVILACDGKFFYAHKLVLSTCSEYFEQIFQETDCKHPVIVLKDIKSEELGILLDYMYIGEVDVVQNQLEGLLKVAECLMIKGLAVPDEEAADCLRLKDFPNEYSNANEINSREKRCSDVSLGSQAKRQSMDNSRHYGKNNSVKRKSNESNKFQKNNVSDTSRNLRPVDECVALPMTGASNGVSSSVGETTSREEHPELIKSEPAELEPVYISGSKDFSFDQFDDGQQHIMDELLGQTSASDHDQMVTGDEQSHDYTEASPPLHLLAGAEDILRQTGDDPQPSLIKLERSLKPRLNSRRRKTKRTTFLPTAVPVNELDMFTVLISYRTYRCPGCFKLIKGDRQDFRRHYMTHTGEKPFHCPHCPLRYTRKTDLRKHIGTLHISPA